MWNEFVTIRGTKERAIRAAFSSESAIRILGRRLRISNGVRQESHRRKKSYGYEKGRESHEHTGMERMKNLFDFILIQRKVIFLSRFLNSFTFLMCLILPCLMAFHQVVTLGSIAPYPRVILEFFSAKTFIPISEFAPISSYSVISLLLSLILIGASFAFASKGSAYPDKSSAHERGSDLLGDARSRFDT